MDQIRGRTPHRFHLLYRIVASIGAWNGISVSPCSWTEVRSNLVFEQSWYPDRYGTSAEESMISLAESWKGFGKPAVRVKSKSINHEHICSDDLSPSAIGIKYKIFVNVQIQCRKNRWPQWPWYLIQAAVGVIWSLRGLEPWKSCWWRDLRWDK